MQALNSGVKISNINRVRKTEIKKLKCLTNQNFENTVERPGIIISFYRFFLFSYTVKLPTHAHAP